MNILEKTQKCKKLFSIPIEKGVTKIDKDVNESVVIIYYKVKILQRARFIASSWTNLVDNLIEGICKIKCKDYDCFLEYESVKDNSIKYKWLSCDKGYSNKIDEELKKNLRTNLSFLIMISIILFCC